MRRADGTLHSRQYYMAFGEERLLTPPNPDLPTDRTYTGQREIEFGLVQYGARIYDPVLARWVQPDAIIPEASQGIQAWDRYAYVNNSPIKATDPTGHFANIIIGAAIGVVVNVGLYMWNEVGNQDGYNWQNDGGDLLCAAIQGAVVGGLIGSGVGAGAGVTLAMSAGLGAASNLVSDQVGNLITGDDYNWATTSIDTTMGGVSGALTMGQSGLNANLISGSLQSVGYGLDSLATNQQMTTMGLLGSFASGFISQAGATGYEKEVMKPLYEDFGEGVARITSKGLSATEAKIYSNTIVPSMQALGTGTIQWISNLYQVEQQ